ncbi:MAG: hypothetical protein LBD34_02485 [Puniceicoccales bacterium]|nr:hypothetical protein [Puniceicoccales bacterium]
MGKNRQQPGLSIPELIFVLALMGAFAACFAIKPFKSEDDVVYETKIALSEAVFLARLQSMSSNTPAILTLTSTSSYDSLDGFFELKVETDYHNTKYSKRLDSRISSCELVDFPWRCKSSDRPQYPFVAGETPKEVVVFEEKFFIPFQLKFLLDDQEWYITVDANAQTHIYKKE